MTITIVIIGSTNLIEGFGKVNIILLRGKKFTIDNALFSSQSKRNLLNFKNIHCNGYHIAIDKKNVIGYLHIIPTVSNIMYITKITCFMPDPHLKCTLFVLSVDVTQANRHFMEKH